MVLRQQTLRWHAFVSGSQETAVSFFTLLFFLITRLVSFRTQPTYYDSFEYIHWLDQATWHNWFVTLSQTHQPVHTLYLSLAFLFKQLFPFLTSGAIFAPLTFFPAFLLVMLWPRVLMTLGFEKRAALWSGLILSFLPLFFLASTAVVYEPLLLLMQVLSLWIWVRSCQTEKVSHALIAGALFGLAVNTFVGTLIITPAFLAYWILQGRKKRLCLAFLLPAFLLPISLDFHLFQSPYLVWGKYFGHSSDVPLPDSNLVLWFARMARNTLFQLAAQAGWTGLFLALLGSFQLPFQRLPRATQGSLATLFVCGVITTQYWHAGLFGRLSLVLALLLSTLIALVASTKKTSGIFVVLLLLPTVVHLSSIMRSPLPAEERLQALKKMCDPEKCIVVTAAPQSFWYEQAGYTTFAFRIGDPEVPAANDFIENGLQENKIVLVDWIAQRWPYFQYDGPIWHIMSMGKTNQSATRPLWDRWNIKLIGSAGTSPSMFSQVVGQRNPQDEIGVVSSYADKSRYFLRHLQGYDPLFRAFWIHRSEVVTNWHYTSQVDRELFSNTLR